ncbi:hypothetical protein BU24DRAFT_417343 [Aaosphaeria arxii CBS 175.79]|uniref:Uncharacterized protein n=1 Tax=Aaosphaeria arxii CBS 175.79 TaxID=1450172 RepID=A0A6A5Y8I1_9PLEO|nr:uncharacterized protein BU24DRAFT_417343 [Aaosphaeria arxii CBS 175.79]KAF2021708.1 hypothetical protein BU24DRAFT_417343 [Aaosphaeria arxii CBS 175.79]
MSSILQENSDQEQLSNLWNLHRFISSLFIAENLALRKGDSGSTATDDIAQQNEDALQLLAARDSATDIESDEETGGTGQEDADDFVIVTGSDYDTDDDSDWETVVGSEQDNDSQNRDDILRSPMPQQRAQPKRRPRR